MTTALFWGCFLVAFGPPAVVFVRLVGPRAQLFIVALTASFFWLVSLLLSSIVWALVPPFQTPAVFFPVAVVFQEIARLYFFFLYERSERSFSVISTNAVVFPLSDLSSSLSAGLGFGIAHVLMVFGTLLANATGPGTLFSPSCSAMSAFVESAWLSLAYNILHMAMMVVAFDSYRRQDMRQAAAVLLVHLAAGLSTLMNATSCLGGLVLVWAVTAVAVGGAWFVARRRGYRSLKY